VFYVHRTSRFGAHSHLKSAKYSFGWHCMIA
jgi:hypothetical protein